MRATPRSIVVTLVASLVVSTVAVACKDREPTSATSPRTLAARQSSAGGSMAGVTIPTAGGFTSEVLSRSRFPEGADILLRVKMDPQTMAVHVDGSGDMIMAKVTIQSGGALPWHTHPGPALVSVKSGELTVVRADGCTVYRYPAGTSLVDPGHGMVHVAFNSAAAGATVLYVTYLDVPPGQSPLIPVANPGC